MMRQQISRSLLVILSLALPLLAGCSDMADPLERPARDGSSACIACHTSQTILAAAAVPGTSQSDLLKVLISNAENPGSDGYAFLTSVHGLLGCISCHGGVDSYDKAVAHSDLVSDPSEQPATGCQGSGCHDEIVHSAETSLHANLTGMRTMISHRAGEAMETNQALSTGFEMSCNECHASCGQCHISRPTAAGGGLLASHKFSASPSMIDQCTACHSRSIRDEYLGKMPGYESDVHHQADARMGGKGCLNCHTAAEMHGANGDRRYEVAEMPRCEDCHAHLQRENQFHRMHWGGLSCQVCHAQDYQNCDSCHLPDGLAGEAYRSFKIGKNPISDDREYEYVTLRHVPIVPDSYAGWGYAGNLPNYDEEPTWKYASPHNISRWTARTAGQSCLRACHDTPATPEGYFLRSVDIEPDEAAANAPVIVPDGSPTRW